uniref:Uncharacterized protein n=1 Tax=Aplanochytrium stocchinoi TaxID=215587 RepID=A0A7S3PIY0_9STRA|mmetsp:Transcript_14192/g.16455  ORF Transcript_14192/g.16455 Transcript_14192/m.16455 type:complete len:335 (+) Transcript_14192:131-1135(+)|eukprot:CAMPEP_0204825256 /NCGR_PEP_ID=MMETSP1346-20131115/3180_1 /ASSEMBLY_ACC=CAM_ASM_000771 /TAXON_ID=215587 /ORGANISM="Aplanochytrium stocchinoi, Strain GSBS06" /LENGTH=334 /DNA_ID=CAMNT_0051952825 /DNA_START=96 /DNA_END=1100 /DNA_ORIENTATION=+
MTKKKEIYTYEAPWPVYGLCWSERLDDRFQFRLAVGSFIEQYKNKVQIIQYDESTDAFVKKSQFDHPYPTTKLQWIPDPKSLQEDLLATSGDYLRLWSIPEDEGENPRMTALLNNSKNSDYCAPLTSFDWNQTAQNIIGTSSIDTTCTIWDIHTQQALTQLIAHDEEVFDIAFAKEKDIFASTGADGSVRMFDIRSLESSTVVYESGQGDARTPLLRLAWNKLDPFYLATVSMDSPRTMILDIRWPKQPLVADLRGHSACINAIAWAPHSPSHICTAGDDTQALIWHLSDMPRPIEDPILAYSADSHINNLQWSSATPDWVAIAYDKSIQVLRV